MSEYTLGESRSKPRALFETKQGDGSGAGYERWRSWEWRPETARKSKEDVYIAHHRLLAVVACYPDDIPVGEILEHLKRKDVHHNAPEADGSRGVKWDNRPDCLHVREHSTHAEITQAEMRAWAEDDRRRVHKNGIGGGHDQDRCDRCGEEADALGTSSAFDGERCIECATATSSGETINL